MTDNVVSGKAYNALQQRLTELTLQHCLISALLAADYTHPGVVEFRRILHEDFLAFSNQESALKEEAAILLRLQSILAELEIISTYPEFHKKRTIAVAGGFSTGKSEFISSLFTQENIRLPIGIQPTTAIPTYAMHSQDAETNEVLGCSIRGGTINLLDIDPDLQDKLSHDFIRSFGFNLKSIMPYIFLSTPMPYEHLCFIDTPGYNPSDTTDGYTNEDAQTAGDFIQNAEAVLWLIGADANGTIPNTDLAFLADLAAQDKPLYIVLNKADLKPQEDLEDILDIIAETLADEDISVAGITAYSATQRRECCYRDESFNAFLSRINIPSNKHHNIEAALNAIEKIYIDAIRSEEKRNKKISGQLKSLQLDLFQKDVLEPNDAVSARIDYIAGFFSTQNIAQRIDNIRQITADLQKAVNQVFGGLPTYHHDHNTPTANPLDDITNKLNDLKQNFAKSLENPTETKAAVIDGINSGMEKIEDIFSSFFNRK